MRGGDTAGLRAFNERLVIDTLLIQGPLSKAEIARATGLSGQAASVIVNSLLSAGLLTRGEKVRGQIGQPSTPIGLNPEGAFSLGAKIGRRSVEAVLVNMVGEVVASRSLGHAAPLPGVIATARTLVSELRAELDPRLHDRLVGLGVAMPSDIHAWPVELGLGPADLDGWRNLDVAEALGDLLQPITVFNDATAACAAEMIAGDGIVAGSTLYLYLGTFIGAGVVLDGKLFRGASANAGAIASMPTCRRASSGQPAQLARSASIFALEQALEAAGLDPVEALATGVDTRAAGILEAWAEDAVPDIARAAVSALSVIDFEAIVVDGLLPPSWRRHLTHRISAEIRQFDLRGLAMPKIATGSIGPMARVLGAALLPLKARFSPDTELLVRSQAGSRSYRAGELQAG
jgi:predicted NBD/HSP70 family sugar kinase